MRLFYFNKNPQSERKKITQGKIKLENGISKILKVNKILWKDSKLAQLGE